MASSGTEKTGTLKGSLYVKFEWSVDNINTSARTGTLHYKVYCTRDDSETYKYYVYDTNNYFKIDGTMSFVTDKEYIRFVFELRNINKEKFNLKEYINNYNSIINTKYREIWVNEMNRK